MVDQKKLEEIFLELSKILPKFKDGRLNYTNAKRVLATTAFIFFDEKLLLLKRSEKVGSYKGRWNGISGYIDRLESVEDRMYAELSEEIGVDKENIAKIRVGVGYQFEDSNRNFSVWPVLVVLKNKPEIKLDWEHDEYKWIDPEGLDLFETVPHLDIGLDIVRKLI